VTRYIIAPSILSADFLQLGNEIDTCVQAGADWIHIDVMDGAFVPNITMGPFVVEHVRRRTDLPIDVHLMIEKPERYVEAFTKAGASHLTVHVENCVHLHRTLQFIKSLGVNPGVTLDPATPALLIQPSLYMVDLVLVMSTNPGFSGQTFIPEVLPKITEIRRMLDEIGSQAWLEVDGGITAQNIGRIKAAGATAFVSASSVFKHQQGAAAGIKALRAQL
jgi:ribulose-phosphate 3-epimerase